MAQKRIRTSIETEFEVCGQRATGKIKNVSTGGLFVGTASIPDQGESVDLSFRAPDGDEISISGFVWWTTRDIERGTRQVPGFGLCLLEENEDFARLVASL